MALLWAFPVGFSYEVLKNLSCGGVIRNKWLMSPFELSTFCSVACDLQTLCLGDKGDPFQLLATF